MQIKDIEIKEVASEWASDVAEDDLCTDGFWPEIFKYGKELTKDVSELHELQKTPEKVQLSPGPSPTSGKPKWGIVKSIIKRNSIVNAFSGKKI